MKQTSKNKYKTTSLLLCWPSYSWAWAWACHQMGLIYLVALHCKQQIFPLPAGISGKQPSSWLKWNFVHTLFSVLGVLFDLTLCKPCVDCHCLCEFICGSVLLYLEDAVSLEFFITSDSYNLSAFSSTLVLEGRGLMISP